MDLYNIVYTLHSTWAYFVIIMLLVAIINAITGMRSGRKFVAKDLRLSLFALIFTHLQLLIGIIMYFVSPKGIDMMKNTKIGEMDSYTRLLALEHPTIGILAVIFITLGWSLHKRQLTDKKTFSRIAIFYGIGLIILLVKLPWLQWMPWLHSS